jgi:hypothetical protein
MHTDWWYVEPIEDVIRAGFADEGDFCAHKTRIGGASPKRILRSKRKGQLYIYKAESQAGKPEAYRAQADRLAASVARALLEQGDYIPVGLFTLDYGKGPVLGSVQPFVAQDSEHDGYRPWSHGKPRPDDLKRLSQHLACIQREQVLDWLISNHDSHGNQWIRVNGKLLGIDKTQACKHLGQDRLDPEYHPNAVYGEDYPLYHYLFHAARSGWEKIDPHAVGPVLERAGAITDKEFLAHFAGYLGTRPQGDRQRLEDILLERKHRLNDDFSGYYSQMLGTKVTF